MKFIQINYNNIVFKLYKLINYVAVDGVKPLSACDKFVASRIAQTMLRWVTCEGHPGLAKFKLLSGMFVRIVMGAEILDTPPRRIRRWFRYALRRAEQSHLQRLFWISVFNIHRLVVLDPEYEVASITRGFEGDLNKFIRVYGKNLLSVTATLKKRFRIKEPGPINLRWSVSGSSGPNGSPAWRQLILDACAVWNDPLREELFKLFSSLPIVEKEEWTHIFWNLFNTSREAGRDYDGKPLQHSRLAFLSDKAGKTRVVAIVDMLSQTLLKPVHDHMNRLLRVIPMDGTFDQDKQRKRVQSWTESDKFCASIDLSSCTDRFPALFQALVCYWTGALTSSQALAWLGVITRRDFLFDNKKTKSKEYIRYSVGQPMGALSSWPVMAFSHHVLVQLSYRDAYPELSDNVFTEYALLGDDLVIQDERVAKSYKELIACLGMPFSPSKSFEGQGLAEFAKSLFKKGEDLKPFPLALLQFRKNTLVTDVLALVKELSERKLRIDFADLLKLVSYNNSRMKRLATLAVLSPSSDKRCLGGFPTHHDSFGTFESFLLSKRVDYFLRKETYQEQVLNWKEIALADLAQFTFMTGVGAQVSQENSRKYPVKIPEEEANSSPRILVGAGWVAYDREHWPDGIPRRLSKILVPGPSWKKDNDDVIHRSSLLEMHRIVPDYFWPSCHRRTWPRSYRAVKLRWSSVPVT